MSQKAGRISRSLVFIELDGDADRTVETIDDATLLTIAWPAGDDVAGYVHLDGPQDEESASWRESQLASIVRELLNGVYTDGVALTENEVFRGNWFVFRRDDEFDFFPEDIEEELQNRTVTYHPRY